MFEECTAPINSLVDLASLSTPVNDLSTLQLSIYLSTLQLTAINSPLSTRTYLSAGLAITSISSSVNSWLSTRLSTHSHSYQLIRQLFRYQLI